MKIGIAGPAGSGKSTVAKLLNNYLHFKILSLDKIGHECLEKNKDKITKIFNLKNFDRKELGKIVFNSKEKLEKLNSIVHPCIIEKVKKNLNNNENIIVEGTLIFDFGIDKFLDAIIFTYAPFEMLVKRFCEVKNYDEKTARNLLNYQKKLKLFENIRKSNFVIFTTGTLKDLEFKVKKISQLLKNW